MKNKSFYISPTCEEYAVAPERVIAASPDMGGSISNPFGETPDEEDWSS